MKTYIALLLLTSTAVACDDYMEQQTNIMQQQLNTERNQAWEQRQANNQAKLNAEQQMRQERFNTFSTNMILLDGQNRR
jgi:hypothetical protein